ncbi:MAG TPA: GWxTD domain-containing protein [Thermoanaerobaculia bacterium]
MNLKRTLSTAVLVAAVALNGFALTPEHTAWGKGPASYLMTKDEQAKWKSIKTDEEAEQFVALFWARRDPTPTTQRNEFREEFDERVKYADDQFTAGKKAGSLTDRGRIFVLFGKPTKVQRSEAKSLTQQGFGTDPSAGGNDSAARQIWIYEDSTASATFGVPQAFINFIDQYSRNEFVIDRGGPRSADISRAQQRVIEKAITQPNLTTVPTYAAAPAAPATAAPAPAAATAPAAPAAAAAKTAFDTAAFQTAVNDFRAAKANPYASKPIYTAWGEYVTTDGTYFVPVSLYVPKDTGLTADSNVTFFGAITDAQGNVVQVIEEPAKLQATTTDFYYDKSLSLPAGTYKATFGLAEAGKPVSMVSTDMTLAGAIPTTEQRVSQLLLANNIYPMQTAQLPNDPFAFGGVKVVPKADKTFRQTDELWYFFEMMNPGRNEQGIPKVQIKLDLEGKEAGSGRPVKAAQAPREAEVNELRGVTGHYGVGSAIPLSNFEPGDYTLKVKVIDTVDKKTYNLQQDFKIVK